LSVLTKPRLILPLLAVIASCALAGPIVATASASDTSIIQVVNHWSPIVGKDENKILAAEAAYKRDRKAAPVIKGLKREIKDLNKFASALKAQKASSRTGAKGRDDIATGARKIAGAYGTFASELKQAGPNGLSKKQIKANAKAANAGHKKIVAGINLLRKL
jgi:translation initiation factor 1 (eIF-1/SUI1)